MPQRKRQQQFFGMHRAFAFHPEVNKFSAKYPGVIRETRELAIVLRLAASRDAFSDLSATSRRAAEFGVIYRRDPDAVLKLMLLLRKILSKWEETEAGKVKIFLLTHRTACIDKRTPIHDSKGNCVAVVSKSLLDGTERRHSTTGLSQHQASTLAFPNLVHVGNLLDKQIAALLNVKAESVKKARQFIADLDAKLEFWENPEVKNFYRTGIMTPNLKRLVKSKFKEKKH